MSSASRGWLDRRDFLNGVALGQTMPGPLAAQVAMWVGKGWQGSFAYYWLLALLG